MTATAHATRAARGLDGHVLVVTGAGQGIGRAFSLGLAEAGAFVVVADVNDERAASVAAEAMARGGAAASCHMDVADAGSVAAAIDRVVAERGRVDGLVNNAALFSTLKMRPFDQIPLDEWDRVMQVNLTGVMLACRAVAGPMRGAGYGRIVNISSAAVKLGRPNYLHYIASKSALIGMTSSLARELGPAGITVNAICPGAISTEIPRETVTPEQIRTIIGGQCVPRSGTPEDLVSTLRYLLLPELSFVTGQTITVDGGAVHAG